MQKPLDEDLANVNKSEFEFYRDFLNIEEAQSFVQFLEYNKINYSLETSETIIDSAIVGNGLIPKALIKIAPIDFKKVNELIKLQIENVKLDDLKDHYLNEFENSELEEIFLNQEDWTIEDIYLAQKILKGRGVTIEDSDINKYRKQSLIQTQQGKSGSWFWILFYSAGIIFGFFLSFIFIIAGLGMAYYYAFGKSTNVDGNNHYIYDDSTRQIGIIMLYGGVTVIVFEFVFISYILN